MNQSTLAIIKPSAIIDGHTNAILAEIQAHGFQIKEKREEQLTKARIQAFYAEHKERPFFANLCRNMIGKSLILHLVKKKAILDFRTLIGATDPAKADPKSLRYRFGRSIDHNALHGSDSPKAAERELRFFFPAKMA